jgi:hypothetical protein
MYGFELYATIIAVISLLNLRTGTSAALIESRRLVVERERRERRERLLLLSLSLASFAAKLDRYE